MKKYELTSEFVTDAFGAKLFRIKATASFGSVEKGQLGGFIEKEDNLSHDGNAWVYGDARVSGDAMVCGDARVSGDADYAVVLGFGRFFRATTFFRCKDKILRVQCGCFYGDMTQFREIVKKTHGDSKYAKEYLAIADLMELHFSDADAKQEAAQ
uniref:Transferase, nesg, ydcK, Structural Genomics.38A n=1 Tax=Ackermannviridae sp. TaxID=2831612 RepID=A0A8S5RQL4_9CAUD|nr:MAG TPA: Putative transferase, nesg, ydcK, Structural Genomics.38A [Ackermannviridae sp.]